MGHDVGHGDVERSGLFQTIRVAPVVNAKGSSVVRLTFHPNEEPAHVTIQIYADGE